MYLAPDTQLQGLKSSVLAEILDLIVLFSTTLGGSYSIKPTDWGGSVVRFGRNIRVGNAKISNKVVIFSRFAAVPHNHTGMQFKYSMIDQKQQSAVLKWLSYAVLVSLISL